MDDDIVEQVRAYLGISNQPESLIDVAERMEFRRKAYKAEYLERRRSEAQTWILYFAFIFRTASMTISRSFCSGRRPLAIMQ